AIMPEFVRQRGSGNPSVHSLGQKFFQNVEKSAGIVPPFFRSPIRMMNFVLDHLTVKSPIREAVEGKCISLVVCQPGFEFAKFICFYQIQTGLIGQAKSYTQRLVRREFLLDLWDMVL